MIQVIPPSTATIATGAVHPVASSLDHPASVERRSATLDRLSAKVRMLPALGSAFWARRSAPESSGRAYLRMFFALCSASWRDVPKQNHGSFAYCCPWTVTDHPSQNEQMCDHWARSPGAPPRPLTSNHAPAHPLERMPCPQPQPPLRPHPHPPDSDTRCLAIRTGSAIRTRHR